MTTVELVTELAVRRFDSAPYHNMDDFVKKAFEQALNAGPNIDDVEKQFEETYPELFPIFIKQIGEERAQRFLEDVIKQDEHEQELVLMVFIFFVAGWTLRLK